MKGRIREALDRWHALCKWLSVAIIDPRAEPNANLADLLAKTVHDVLELARAELALAKREALVQARALGTSAVLLFIAVMFLQAALTTLGVLLALTLRPVALGFAVVGGLIAIALALGLLGVRSIKQLKFRTPARVQLDATAIAEAIK